MCLGVVEVGKEMGLWLRRTEGEREVCGQTGYRTQDLWLFESDALLTALYGPAKKYPEALMKIFLKKTSAEHRTT